MKNLYEKYFILVFLWLISPNYNNTLAQSVTYELRWYQYYEPAEGKIVGIWPHVIRWSDSERLSELRNKWGFNHIIFWSKLGQQEFNMAKQTGYIPATDIMRSIEADDYLTSAEYDNCWAYYLDEPGFKLISFNTVQTIRNWSKANFPDALFIISGYKRDSELINLTNSLADKVLFSSYIHWWKFLGFWISWPEDPDQRSDWTDMKNLFGNKFSMTWISANSDLSEYDRLLGHASNLGLEGVWLYQDNTSGPEVNDDNLASFCENAVNHGFMIKKYQQVRDKKVNEQFISSQFTGLPYASSIPANYDHTNLIFNNDVIINNHRIDNYYAGNSITAGGQFSFIIPEGKSASFNTQNYIQLKPGFHAAAGSNFRAFIGD